MDKQFNFKKFTGRNTRFEDRISVTKSHTIGFPSKFYDDNNIKNYQYVILFWDEANKAIGIQFTNNEEEKDKFSILHSKKGYGANVISRSFFRSNSIDPIAYSGRYNWNKQSIDDIGEIFIIELRKKEE